MEVLKPAYDLTTILSAESYPTMSLIIPLIRGVQSTLGNVQPSTAIGELLKNKLLEIVNRRLGAFESNKIAARATFLDPRFKKLAFGNTGNAETAQKLITDELYIIMAQNTNSITNQILTR